MTIDQQVTSIYIKRGYFGGRAKSEHGIVKTIKYFDFQAVKQQLQNLPKSK